MNDVTEIKQSSVGQVNDVELAFSINKEIGTHYENSKRLLQLGLSSPSLVSIRSVINLICLRLGSLKNIDLSKSVNLGERIHKLKSKSVINSDIARKLQDLRIKGNVGAHPEEDKHSNESLIELATQSIKDCCELIQDVLLQTPGKKQVLCDFVEVVIDSDLEVKDILFDAIFDNNSESIFEISLLLENVYKKQKIEEEYKARSNGELVYYHSQELLSILNKYHSFLQMAADLDHSESLFKVGMLKVADQIRFHDAQSGERDIHLAASLGNINAKAQLGDWYMTGTDNIPKDETEALRYLSESSEHDHPLALTVLGDIEQENKKYKAAYEFYMKAAEAGFSSAKIMLAKMIIDGKWKGDFDQVKIWLLEARADHQFYADYYLSFARLQLSTNPEEIELSRMFLHSINVSDPEILYEVSMYLSKSPLVDESLPMAATKISQAYRIVEKPSLLHGKIKALCKRIYDKLVLRCNRNEFVSSAKQRQDLGFALSQFDKNGIPRADPLEGVLEVANASMTKPHNSKEYKDTFNKYIGEVKAIPVKINKVGVNAVCPCGSGKKFKKCCR